MKKSMSGSGWWLHCLVVLAIVVCAFSMPKPAQATPSVGTGVSSTTAIINKIVNSTPGLNKIVVGSSGVSVVASGETAVAARGMVIPVAAEATATVTAGRLAGVIAKGIKVGSWVGIASVVAPWIMDQAGIKVCPPPDFFCKAGPDTAVDPSAGGWYISGSQVVYGGTPQAVCSKFVLKYYNNAVYGDGNAVKNPNGSWTCYAAKNGSFIAGIGSNSVTCPPGSTKGADGFSCTTKGPDVPASEGDVGGALEDAMTKVPSRMGTAVGGLQSVNGPIWSGDDAVTVKPMTTTTTVPTQTTVETVPKPDGSIDTVTTKVDAVVKPVVSGTNLGDTKIDYPTTITTTTTTTNNVTNVTTTTINVTNVYATPEPKTRDNPPDPGPPPPIPQSPADVVKGPELKIPDDYNREGTQQKVLSELTKLNNPEISAKAPDGNDQVDAYKAKGVEGDTAISGITEASIGFKAWFPSLPTAQCLNPKVPGVGDSMYEIPLCDKLDVTRIFLSALVCAFCLVACVAEVQTALRS